MKKLILAIAVVALFTACNSASTEAPSISDSTSIKVVDSLKVDSSKSIIDTIKK